MQATWHTTAWEDLSRNDLYDLLQLRISVFVVEQHCPYQECDDKDQKSHHLFLRNEEEKMVACLRIVKPGISYHEVSIGRVATSSESRGTGLGRELMKRGLEFIVQQYGMVPVRISAQLYLRAFYESFGFLCEGESYLEDDIPHIEMILKTP